MRSRPSPSLFPAALLWAALVAASLFPTDRAMAESQVLLVSGSHDWVPYLMVDPTTGRARGALYDVLIEACRAVGAECLFLDYPWKRVLDYLDYGDIDICCGIYPTVSRQGQYIFSAPIYQDEVRVLTAKPMAIDSFDDLKGLRGDALLGASYGDVADARIDLYLDVVRWTDKTQSLLRLIRGDSDYMICPQRDCLGAAQSMHLRDKVRIQPLVLSEMDVHIAFSRHSKHPEILEAVNRELDRMIASGRVREILQPYLRD